MGALPGSCLSPSTGSQGIAITLQGMWRYSEAHWLSLASGYRLGLVRHSECDALAEVAAMELVKKNKHPAPHI